MLRGMNGCASAPKEGEEDYEQQVRAWARAVMAEQTPVEGGFAVAPIFPARLVSRPGCGQLDPSASASLVSH